MPSVVIGQPTASGAQVVISGNPYSGRIVPIGEIKFIWTGVSGNCYIAMSGGGPPLSGGTFGTGFMTLNSGAMQLSGGCLSGMLDGMPITPGSTFVMPGIGCTNRGGTTTSGIFNVWALVDAAASGGRLFFECL